MTKKELQSFIESNKERKDLEYKLKPNFNEIKNTIEHLTKRMHFNILKTIYAFANTEGGTLFIGISEDKEKSTKKWERTIVGVDNCDQELIKSLCKRISKKITIKKEEIIKLKEEKREVIKIVVNKLKMYDKPQLLDGILYFRDNDSTKSATEDDWRKILYIEEQFYLYYLEGVRDNLYKIRKDQDTFMAKQFITGLKQHIEKFANENQITDNDLIKKLKKLLNKIQSGITKATNLKSTIDAPMEQHINIDKDIEDFVKTYKTIIEIGV